jgi:hypothetical protein
LGHLKASFRFFSDGHLGATPIVNCQLQLNNLRKAALSQGL